MDSAIRICGLSPHPPIIIPEVGKGEEREAASTIAGLTVLSREIVSGRPETLVVITPHGLVFSDAVSVRAQARHRGSLAGFGAPRVSFDLENDLDLVKRLVKEAKKAGGPKIVAVDDPDFGRYRVSAELDHGTQVPLYFLDKAGFSGKLAVINIGFLSYQALYETGVLLEKVCSALGRRVSVLASGDLSHRLKPGAPAGFNPRGEVFDKTLMSLLDKFDVPGVMNLPGDLVEDAGECGMRPLVLLLGALHGLKIAPKVLSYQGPYGVGYGVVLFRPSSAGSSGKEQSEARKEQLADTEQKESFAVSLARQTVEEYVRKRKILVPSGTPLEFQVKGGAFVTIYKRGALRGCIGTVEGIAGNLAQEIVSNAVSASSRDPRFPPVSPDELADLDYSVDVLSSAQPVRSLKELDPKKYGVICEKGRKRGLLLPDLEGVETARQQVSIAREKAGILPGESGVKLYRFTVTRYK